MLSISLAIEESMLVVDQMQVTLKERHAEEGVTLSVTTAADRFLALKPPQSRDVKVSEAKAGQPVSLWIQFGSVLQLGEIKVYVSRYRTQQVKLCVRAPKRFKVKRPAQHGGSLRVKQ